MKHLLFALLALLAIVGCQKTKTCDLPCKNGGICDDGTCICKTGYEGPYCQHQTLPKNIVIEQIDVVRKPDLDPNGHTWDIGTNPDFFVTVLDQNGSLIYKSPTINNLSGVPSWTTAVYINNPAQKHKFDLYDEDATSVEWMGGVDAAVYYASNGFPNIVELKCDGCPVWLKLKVSYRF